MMVNLKAQYYKDIVKVCKDYGCTSVVLFGSRARGDNTEVSDIDIAVAGALNFDRLSMELKYNEFTLLDIDVVNLDSDISKELRNRIERDGVALV